MLKMFRVLALRLISQVADTVGKENLKQYKGTFQRAVRVLPRMIKNEQIALIFF